MLKRNKVGGQNPLAVYFRRNGGFEMAPQSNDKLTQEVMEGLPEVVLRLCKFNLASGESRPRPAARVKP